ncbi:MAG: metalloregulator ArsR/SmtB family transcription factor [Chitinivibrionales bacterium]|nr:metalloregulator ArsR/SmtB family transcription factor [Chitinivibrionales bacterium]
MKKEDTRRFEAQSQIIKALAHPTRLFIAEELGKGERCVCELTGMIGADTSTVSKHLFIMKNAGIIECEKRGTNMYYTLKMKCVLSFFSCVNQVLQKKAAEQLQFV